MSSHTQFHRRALSVLVVLAAAVALPAASASAAKPEPPSVPTRIQVADGHKLFLVGHAVGVQIYSCTATATGPAWALTAPRADLYDDKGKVIITHGAGPSWQSRDGSTIVGKRVDGVTVDPTAIPWLLVSATPTDPSDTGRLAGTKFIQRVATTGGLPPAPATCTADTVGAVSEVPYTADYYFWKATA